jgi:hypothetical protein
MEMDRRIMMEYKDKGIQQAHSLEPQDIGNNIHLALRDETLTP